MRSSKRESRSKRILLGLVALASLVAVTVVGVFAFETWPRLRAKKTVTDMKSLASALNAYEPDSTDAVALRRLIEESEAPLLLKDAWGSDFVVQRIENAGGDVSYSVRSLGRDGKEGSCCQRWVTGWDEDALIVDSEWVQVWD